MIKFIFKLFLFSWLPFCIGLWMGVASFDYHDNVLFFGSLLLIFMSYFHMVEEFDQFINNKDEY